MFFIISVILTVVIAYIIGNKSNESKGLNYFLFVLLIIDFVFFLVFSFNNIPKAVSHILSYLNAMTSSLDLVVLVALITGLISLLNSFYSRYSDNKNRLREYLSAKREVPYSEFIELCYKLAQNGKDGFEYNNADMTSDINNFNTKITLWGSYKVVKKWGTLRKTNLIEEYKENSEKQLILMEELMNQMRKDLGVGVTGKGKLLSFFINDIEKIIEKIK